MADAATVRFRWRVWKTREPCRCCGKHWHARDFEVNAEGQRVYNGLFQYSYDTWADAMTDVHQVIAADR